jgi:tRNA U34 5-carboxymethylaminomethyl modifying GTPase MnmE/TrmE
LDGSEPLADADKKYLEEFVGKKRILVRNKIDLPQRLELPVGGGSSSSASGAATASRIAPAEQQLRPTAASVEQAGMTGDSKIRLLTPALSSPVDSITDSMDVGARGAPRPTQVVDVSCVTGQGIEPLKDAIKELAWSGEIKAEMLQVMINSRHQDALNRARAAAVRSREALGADASLDLVALDLHIAVNAVGEIVGKTATEDLLDSIFSQFCIGK